MTYEEVKGLLGGREPVFCFGGSWNMTYIWAGESGTIGVHFTWDGSESRASAPAGFSAEPLDIHPSPLLDRLRAWLGW
jgi:hypothetical protein